MINDVQLILKSLISTMDYISMAQECLKRASLAGSFSARFESWYIRSLKDLLSCHYEIARQEYNIMKNFLDEEDKKKKS